MLVTTSAAHPAGPKSMGVVEGMSPATKDSSFCASTSIWEHGGSQHRGCLSGGEGQEKAATVVEVPRGGAAGLAWAGAGCRTR